MFEPTLHHVNQLLQKHGVREAIVHVQQLSGTTTGLVLKMKALTVVLLNRYEACEKAECWGRTEYPGKTWKGFVRFSKRP